MKPEDTDHIKREGRLNKNTQIALGLVVVLLGMVGTGAFAVAGWKADNRINASNVMRLEEKIDAIAKDVKAFNSAQMKSSSELSIVRSEMRILTQRITDIDSKGTDKLQGVESLLHRLEDRIVDLEKLDRP